MHGGECEDGVDGFHCSCHDGYSGDYCQCIQVDILENMFFLTEKKSDLYLLSI